MTRPAFLRRLVPDGAHVLAEVSRALRGRAWTTVVRVQDDGRYAACIVEEENGELILRASRQDASSLAELDRQLAADLARSGPQGDERFAALSSAARAFEEAGDKAA